MRKLLGCLILIVIFSIKLYGSSGTIEDSIIFGLMGGKTYPLGYYKDQLDSGYNFGIFIDYPFFKSRFLYLESDLSYTKLSLKKTSLSSLSYYSFGIGPVLHIPAGTRFKPYCGITATVNYLQLTAVESQKNERTVKIGGALKAGFNVQQYKNFLVNLGLKYSFNELSGKDFQNITYFAGVSYCYNFITREKAEKNIQLIEIDEYYESGVKHFKIGDGLRAKEYFNKVISYDYQYKDVENYIRVITINEENYNKALNLISEDKHFEALPLLVEAEKYLVSAFEKLREIRKFLSKEEKSLINIAIEAYNKGDYEKCIFYMKRVQLINPGNESVNLYLPRALKRYDALKMIE
ncbi:MAG: hypothetical protein JXN64_14455 [Spirochaetes bacterium]|nr:hypothetical protein [Spirochaetota bacterium]